MATQQPLAPLDRLRKQSLDQAIISYGTAYIFEQRANSLRRRLRIVSYVAFLIPLIIGAFALGYGIQEQILQWLIWIGAGLGIVQIVVAGWSIFAKWDDEFAYSVESSAANSDLADRFDRLRLSDLKLAALQIELDLLNKEYSLRKQLDGRFEVPLKERHMGMRAGLWKYQSHCAICNEVPQSMEPTDCPNCGQF